jgi:DNA-binding SARP family transcriptional activator
VALWLTLQRAPSLGPALSLRPLHRKDAALLAVLALDGACSRDTLARMLWPQADPSRSLASLRQRRFRVARTAGATVIVGNEWLRLDAAVLHAASHADALLDALGLDALDGELLDGLDFGDCPDVDRWLANARERWQVLRSQALARAASRLESEGRLAQALPIAQRLALDEPLSDHAHRRLMRMHHRRGDLNAALDVYRTFAERLAAELGELPDDETASLAAALRRGDLPAPRSMPPALARPPLRVGRDAQWRALEQAWTGRQQVLLEGAPGVGKTRLLEDFLATLDAGRVLASYALPGDAGRPYALLARLLARLWFDAGALRPDGAAALPEWARGELAALLPALGPGVARVNPLRLQQAAAQALRDARVALLAVDDVQQADAATLELLAALRGDGLPVGWLAVRSGEVPAALDAWLHASAPPRRIVLRALGADDLRALLADLALPGVDGATWAEPLARHTGGLPLFVLETLRALHEQPGVDLAALPPPARVAQAVLQRLARLPEPARQLAQAAAVWQAPLALEDGAAVVGLPPATAAAAFEALEGAQWLERNGRMHDVIAATLRDAMPAAERRWLHDRIAVRLDLRESPALAAAHHYEAAGRDAEAAVRFEAAARAARRATRPAEDADLHERAADAWARAGHPERAFAARMEAVAPRLFAGGSAAALAVTRRLLADAATPAQRMHALAESAHALGQDYQCAAALPLAREAWALAQSVGSDAERLKVAHVLANQLAYVEATDEALALLAAQRELAERVGGERLQLHLNAMSQVLHRRSRLAECAQVIRDGLALIVADENWREAVTVGGNLALVLGNLGRYEEAWAVLQQVETWRARLGDVEGTLTAAHHRKCGHVLLGLGRLGSALGAFALARAQFVRCDASGAWLAMVDHALADAHLLRGDAEAAARCLQPLRGEQPAFMHAKRVLLQAQVQAAQGRDPAPALAQAHAAVAGTEDRATQVLVALETAALDGGLDDPVRLAGLRQAAADCEQHALAARAGWWQVDALRRRGYAEAAGALARRLLAAVAWPSLLLPCHWLDIAARALAAVDDPQSEAIAARARAAHAQTLADLDACPDAVEGSGARPPERWVPVAAAGPSGRTAAQHDGVTPR